MFKFVLFSDLASGMTWFKTIVNTKNWYYH